MKLYETITAENWYKGAFVGPWGDRRCLLGHALGLGLMEFHNAVNSPVFKELAACARFLYPERTSGSDLDVAFFNDHPDTTVEDVIRVCKLANL